MALFSNEQILERMWFENPWWVNGKIEDYYNEMNRRLYFDLFNPLVIDTSIRRAVVLMGPRRVGKTVMMYHTVQSLLNMGVSKAKIALISIETPIYNKIGLDQLFQFARKATNYLSKELNAKVEIDKLKISFIKNAVSVQK